MSARAVAAKMKMPVRSYYSFEAGVGPLDIDEIHRFAAATDSDAMAILWALAAGAPDIALRCMDNKAASILVASFLRFTDKVGDQVTTIVPAILIEAFQRPFDGLQDHLQKRDQSTERWLEEHLPKLFKGPSKD